MVDPPSISAWGCRSFSAWGCRSFFFLSHHLFFWAFTFLRVFLKPSFVSFPRFLPVLFSLFPRFLPVLFPLQFPRFLPVLFPLPSSKSLETRLENGAGQRCQHHAQVSLTFTFTFLFVFPLSSSFFLGLHSLPVFHLPSLDVLASLHRILVRHDGKKKTHPLAFTPTIFIDPLDQSAASTQTLSFIGWGYPPPPHPFGTPI